MAKSIKTNIVEHLKKKGNYDESIDDYLIDMLMDNLKFANEMKEKLSEEGCIIASANGNGIVSVKQHPAFSVYQMALRNIHQISSRLSISRADRIKLKLIEQKEQDALDDLLD